MRLYDNQTRLSKLAITLGTPRRPVKADHQFTQIPFQNLWTLDIYIADEWPMGQLFNALDEPSNTYKLKRLALSVDAKYRPGTVGKTTGSVPIVRHSVWSTLQDLRLDFFNYKELIAALFR